jgi:hypothetical protein
MSKPDEASFCRPASDDLSSLSPLSACPYASSCIMLAPATTPASRDEACFKSFVTPRGCAELMDTLAVCGVHTFQSLFLLLPDLEPHSAFDEPGRDLGDYKPSLSVIAAKLTAMSILTSDHPWLTTPSGLSKFRGLVTALRSACSKHYKTEDDLATALVAPVVTTHSCSAHLLARGPPLSAQGHSTGMAPPGRTASGVKPPTFGSVLGPDDVYATCVSFLAVHNHGHPVRKELLGDRSLFDTIVSGMMESPPTFLSLHELFPLVFPKSVKDAPADKTVQILAVVTLLDTLALIYAGDVTSEPLTSILNINLVTAHDTLLANKMGAGSSGGTEAPIQSGISFTQKAYFERQTIFIPLLDADDLQTQIYLFQIYDNLLRNHLNDGQVLGRSLAKVSQSSPELADKQARPRAPRKAAVSFVPEPPSAHRRRATASSRVAGKTPVGSTPARQSASDLDYNHEISDSDSVDERDAHAAYRRALPAIPAFRPPGSSSVYNPRWGGSATSSRVCYKAVRGLCTNDDCTWSHDPAFISVHLADEQAKRLREAPRSTRRVSPRTRPAPAPLDVVPIRSSRRQVTPPPRVPKKRERAPASASSSGSFSDPPSPPMKKPSRRSK